MSDDNQLIKLQTTAGYPYPLPPNTTLQSRNPNACIIKMSRFDVPQWSQIQDDGKTYRIFQTLSRAPSVLILPVNIAGEVMLVKTKQPGRPEYNGFVAGDLEPAKDESIYQAAKRELLEEVGYAATSFTVVYFHYFVPGWEWFAYTIIAKGSKKVQEPAPDIGERNRPFFVTVDELERMARAEEFLYPPVMVNKLLLRGEGDRLRRIFEDPSRYNAVVFEGAPESD